MPGEHGVEADMVRLIRAEHQREAIRLCLAELDEEIARLEGDLDAFDGQWLAQHHEARDRRHG